MSSSGAQPMPGPQYHSQSPMSPPGPNMPRSQILSRGPPLPGQMPPPPGQVPPQSQMNQYLNQKNLGNNSQIQNHQNFPGQHPPVPNFVKQKVPENAAGPQPQNMARPLQAMGQQSMPGAPNSSNQHIMSGPPPLSGQQNMSGPPTLSNQQNMPGLPLLPGQQNMSGPSSLPSQQNMSAPLHQNISGPAQHPGQQNMSAPLHQNISGQAQHPGQQNMSAPLHQNISGQAQHPGQQNMSAPPQLPGQQNMSGPPQAPGQPNIPGPPQHPGQQNMSGSQQVPGQQNIPGPPQHLGQQNMSGSQQIPGQQNISGPPQHPGQQNMPGSQQVPGQQNISGPPQLPGQQNMSGPPPLPGQQNMSGPSQHPGQQNMSGPPQLPGQQNISGPSPVSGQQNMSAPPQMPGKQNYSDSSVQGQPPFSGPLLSQQHNMGSPMSPGQQNLPNDQQNLPGRPHLAGPPLPGQQNLSGPPLPGQQNFSSSNSMPGQQGLSGPPLPGQHNLQPHLAGQNQMPGSNQGYSQGNQVARQRQYMAGPPLPGQGMGNPPGVRQPSMPGYQQPGYQQQNYVQPDAYGGQRPYHEGAPGSGPAYQPGVPPQQQPKRLDPDQMPSPIQVIQDDQRARGGDFITNQKGLVPPLVTTKFLVHDQGNASPRFIRSTMYTIPTTSDMIKQSNVPFGLILSPMARVEEGEYEPPIIDMGEVGPIRCGRCKAYMCPFMQFTDAGRRFQCMFCKVTTDVPMEYFQHLDHTGQRMDRYERPELMLGTYEFLATKDYCRNNTFPKPPAIVFVIDVSYNTIKSGLVNLLCRKMKEIIRNLPIDVGQTKTNMKVGFITYNNTVHFYNVKSCLAQPQMMIVGDVQDVFMPLLDGFLCDPEESEAVIDSLMTQIPAMFADTRETEVILAPAIQAGLEALKASECAGKLVVFHSSLPNAEAPGKLKSRDDRKLLGTDKEKNVLAPQNNVYNNLGQDCVASGCSVDLFMFNNSYCDLATISQVCRLTGGEVYKYTYFQAEIDGSRLISDIINNINRPIAFDAVMRIRTSTGIRATDFFGHFFMSNTTDMDIASIDCNKAIAVEIKHDDKLTDDEGVYIQAALLYTSCGGVRRLRIINLSLRSSSQLAELYRTCELDAIVNFFSKQSVFKLLDATPKSVKDNLISRCANMLAAYRKHCASPSSTGQLILPECMKLLPLYVNCLLKSDALSGGADMSIDDRSFIMQAVNVMSIKSSVTYFYPRLMALHDIDPQGTDVPPMIRCSIDKFTDDGAFLLENGIHMFLWLGLALNQQWVQAVFGSPAVAHVDTDRSVLPVLDTPFSKRINDIVARIRSERQYCMRLTIVRQRDKMEVVMRHFLVEDRGNDGSSSYVDFLCHMHKEIRALLS